MIFIIYYNKLNKSLKLIYNSKVNNNTSKERISCNPKTLNGYNYIHRFQVIRIQDTFQSRGLKQVGKRILSKTNKGVKTTVFDTMYSHITDTRTSTLKEIPRIDINLNDSMVHVSLTRSLTHTVKYQYGR